MMTSPLLCFFEHVSIQSFLPVSPFLSQTMQKDPTSDTINSKKKAALRVPCYCMKCRGKVVAERTKRAHRTHEQGAPTAPGSRFKAWVDSKAGSSRQHGENSGKITESESEDESDSQTDDGPTAAPSPPSKRRRLDEQIRVFLFFFTLTW